jgi:hypothetical protein
MKKIKRVIRKIIYSIPLIRKKVHYKNKISKDVQICEIKLGPIRYIKNNYKAVFHEGIASIIEVRDVENPKYLHISLPKKRFQKRLSGLSQFHVTFINPVTGVIKVYPLSMSDYKYMDTTLETTYAEVFITKEKFAKLTSKEIEKRKHIALFNTTKGGRSVLKKLREQDYIIINKSDLKSN